MIGAYPGTIIGNSRHQTFLNVEKDQKVKFFEHLKLIIYSETETREDTQSCVLITGTVRLQAFLGKIQ